MSLRRTPTAASMSSMSSMSSRLDEVLRLGHATQTPVFFQTSCTRTEDDEKGGGEEQKKKKQKLAPVCNPLAASSRSVEVAFTRNSKLVTAVIEYPDPPPTRETDALLLGGGGSDADDADDAAPRQLLCPGCSDQDVVLGRCHGGRLADQLHALYPNQPKPIPRGMAGVLNDREFVELVDDPHSVFVGRRPMRGRATKSIGVKTTLQRSKYANPFVVAKKGFLLGESLALYQRWIEGGYADLEPAEIQEIVAGAPVLAPTLDIEELLRTRPDLFV